MPELYRTIAGMERVLVLAGLHSNFMALRVHRRSCLHTDWLVFSHLSECLATSPFLQSSFTSMG